MKYKYLIATILSIGSFASTAQSWQITQPHLLPEGVSNNAVAAATVNDTAYIYSFSGIDNSKIYSGIHNKAWRYNTKTGETIILPPLPDNLTKIAAGASQVNNIIYIMGGYHVFANGNETTSPKVHRFDTQTNTYLPDGVDIPVPTDDHVQAVWRDSLIYLVTGWSNTANIPNVQIYNPTENTWQSGTPVPNNDLFKSFGASGVIMGDTIFYFGGAASITPAGNPFPIQNRLRIGIINPSNPTDITWSIRTLDPNSVGYRMGATTVGNQVFWLGGAERTYNFDGLAYSDNTTVVPVNRSISYDPIQLLTNIENYDDIPMDLRNIASVNDSTKYILGGMRNNREVSNRIYKLVRSELSTSLISAISKTLELNVYPNPAVNVLQVEWRTVSGQPADFGQLSYQIFNNNGQFVQSEVMINNTDKIDVSNLLSGVYKISFRQASRIILSRQFVILR